jgi:hypothetical protein
VATAVAERVHRAPAKWSHDSGQGRAASSGEARGWRRGGGPVTEPRENWSSAAAAPADQRRAGRRLRATGGATTPFIGDARACKRPVN